MRPVQPLQRLVAARDATGGGWLLSVPHEHQPQQHTPATHNGVSARPQGEETKQLALALWEAVEAAEDAPDSGRADCVDTTTSLESALSTCRLPLIMVVEKGADAKPSPPPPSATSSPPTAPCTASPVPGTPSQPLPLALVSTSLPSPGHCGAVDACMTQLRLR